MIIKLYDCTLHTKSQKAKPWKFQRIQSTNSTSTWMKQENIITSTGCQSLLNKIHDMAHEVAKIQHIQLYENDRIRTPEREWMNQPKAVTETIAIKMLQDFRTRTDPIIPTQRSDNVVGFFMSIVIPCHPSSRHFKKKIDFQNCK